LRRFGARPGSEWHWKFQLLWAENLISLDRLNEAGAVLQPGAGLRPPTGELLARWKLDQAYVTRDPAKSRDLLAEARRLASDSRAGGLLCLIDLRAAALSSSYREAEALYQTALREAEQQRDPGLVGRAWLGIGYNRQRFLRFDEAVPFLDTALKIAEQCAAKPIMATALGNLGACYFRLGDLDRSMRALTRAEALAAEIGRHDSQQRWLGVIGDIHLARGEFDQALAFHHRAELLAREVRNDTWLGFALNNQAEDSLEKGDLAAARSFNEQALAVKRRLNNPGSLVYSELNAAKIEARSGQRGQAEIDYQAVIRRAREFNVPDVLWDACGALASLYRETARPRQAETQYRAAIDTIDRQWNKLGSDEWRVTFLAPHLIRFFQDYVDFLIETGQTRQALEMAESSRARVLNQRLERQGEVPPGFHLDKLLRAAGASHTVILSYWLAPRRSSVWVLGPGRLSRFDLPADKEIGALVQKYTDTILGGADPLARDSPLPAALYEAVLGPVRKLIPPGSNVILVPDGALHQLDFGTLVAPEPRPHYWIEDVAIAAAPSLRVLTGAAEEHAGPPKLLLLGDPAPASADFPPLPNANKEIAAVEAHFPAAARTVFTGADAFPARYAEAAPAGFTTIHFAAHATANRESPLNSAIILSRQGDVFKLYARDVAAVPLRADLVTISACHSAGAKTYSGEGLMGFAWAFLQAGAQNVIASLWDLDDAGSVRLMQSLYAGIAAGETPARALRAAKLALIRAGAQYRRPYFWGPLQVFTRSIAPAAARRPDGHQFVMDPSGRK
jgi:CHAT domain-containing protein